MNKTKNKNKMVIKAVKVQRKVLRAVAKAVRVEKKLVKAVKDEAKSVNFQVRKLSSEVKEDAGKVAGQVVEKAELVAEKAGQVVEKVKHLNVGILLAKVFAGITLAATVGAYSVYLVRHRGKKIDFNKMKINVLREVRKATEEARRIGAMELKKIENEARKVTRKK